MKCEFIAEAVSFTPSGHMMAGPHVAFVYCKAHGMPLGNTPMTSDSVCPIGKIEAATDDAIRKIQDAMRAARWR